jgi:predicted alpha/beta hydrolase family esterase
MNTPRIVFLHGNETSHWSQSWAGWLKVELEKLGFETFFETMPDSIFARAEYWLPFIEDHIQAGENDVIVGWSSGATAAMRFAEDTKIRGSVLISPSYTDLGDEIENMSGYYDEPWRWDDIKKNQDKIALFYGNNDPFIPQKEFLHIAEKLDADKRMYSGAGHFIDQDTFPQLLEYIKQQYL